MIHGLYQKGPPHKARACVFVAVLALALIVPTVALAYSATFSYQTPEPGSGTTDTTPKISVVVYDKYGVRGSTKYNMWVDGVRVVKESLTLTRYSGWGYRKFKLTYQIPTALSFGDHRATVIVKDLRGITSSTSWHYNVIDGVAPVTTSDAVLNYTTGSATIHLFPTDNVAVAHTYYRLDGGVQVAGTQVTVTGSDVLPLHSLEFWSVDTAGNVEEVHKVVFFVPATVDPGVVTHSLPTGANAACFVSGCHDDSQNNVARIHRNAVNDEGAYRGCLCHQRATLSKDCIGCHTATPDMHTPGSHPAIASSGDPSCSQATCHGTAVVTIHDGNCALCHDSDIERVQNAVASGDASCEDCHIDSFVTIHAAGNSAHSVSGACFNANCHLSNAADIHTHWANPPGCAACHAPGVTPTLVCVTCHPDVGTLHDSPHASAAGTLSAGCTVTGCHGSTDILAISPGHTGCSCHTFDSPTLNAIIAAGNAGHPAECLDCHTNPLDPSAAHPYHVGAHDALQSEIAANSAGCVSCHGDNILAVLPPGNPATGVLEHKGCSCHAYGEAEGQTACEDCHVKPMDPTAPYPYHVGAHATLEAGIAGTLSSACVSCHGTNLLDVSAGSAHLAGEHRNCLCHAYGEATPTNTECVDCHEDAYAPHGFVNGLTHTGEGWIPASGHNTTTFGSIGALTKFDGSQGVTLQWESEFTSASLNATWLVEPGFQPATRPAGVSSVTTGQVGTVSTDWLFPTVNVFWKPGDPAAPTDAMFLNASSVVTCQDCHTGLNAAGPHGAADDWGIDPNYPLPYSYAELSKQVVENDGVTPKYPSGIKTRSTLTTATQTYGDGMDVICSKCHDLENYQSGTTKNCPLPLISVGSASFVHDGDTFTPVFVSGSRGGWTVYTDIDGHPATAGTGQAWTQAATGTINVSAVGSSNTAHSSHHQDTADGSAQCVNCHIGVPHGWKRPRLLVNTGWDGSANDIGAGTIVGDAAPYLSPNALGTTRANGGIRIVNGFNGMGMLSLSAVDNHYLNAGSTFPGNSSLPAGMVYETGAAYWSEAGCQACNDHSGEDGIRIIDSE